MLCLKLIKFYKLSGFAFCWEDIIQLCRTGDFSFWRWRKSYVFGCRKNESYPNSHLRGKILSRCRTGEIVRIASHEHARMLRKCCANTLRMRCADVAQTLRIDVHVLVNVHAQRNACVNVSLSLRVYVNVLVHVHVCAQRNVCANVIVAYTRNVLVHVHVCTQRNVCADVIVTHTRNVLVLVHVCTYARNVYVYVIVCVCVALTCALRWRTRCVNVYVKGRRRKSPFARLCVLVTNTLYVGV